MRFIKYLGLIHFNRTLDRYTRASLPECVVSTEHKGRKPSARLEIKIPGLAGNRTRASGLEDRGSTDYATVTDSSVVNIK